MELFPGYVKEIWKTKIRCRATDRDWLYTNNDDNMPKENITEPEGNVESAHSEENERANSRIR